MASTYIPAVPAKCARTTENGRRTFRMGEEQQLNGGVVVARWSFWLVEKLTFKHEIPAKVDAMTMARALWGLSLLVLLAGCCPGNAGLQSQHCKRIGQTLDAFC